MNFDQVFHHKASHILIVIENFIQKIIESTLYLKHKLTEKDKYHLMSLICKILKNNANELIYKTDSDF